MNLIGARLRDSRGMVLISSLAILSALLALGIGARVMLQNDYRTLANLRGSTEAFYYAAAGLEWSKNEIARIAAFPPAPQNQTQSFASGNFAVSFLSSVVSDPLTARIVVRSTGTQGNSSHTVQAQLAKAYDLADAALVLRGNAARINLSGGEIFVSGFDHDPANGNSLPRAKSRSAISVADDAMSALLNQGMENLPANALESANNSATESSEDLPASVVTQLANDLCGAPGAILQSIPSGGNLAVENQLWGSSSTPQLRCIEGLPTSGDAVSIMENVSGAGILVVRNADLVLTDSFHWEGLIIVTGQEVGFRTTGLSSKEIIGAVMIAETGTPGSGTTILDIQGNFRLLFSRLALARTAQLIPNTTLSSLYSALPLTISQDYWRTVSP